MAGVVVCPAGFVSDHLEVLYDLDVEARAAAEPLGLAFARTPSPNADPAVLRRRWPEVDPAMPCLSRACRRRRRRHHRPGHGLLPAPGRRRRSTVLEAGDRLGGKIQTPDLAGVPVESGPDTFLARVPWAVDLCRELGLGDELVEPATGKAFLWTGGRLRPLPERHVLGVPAGLRPAAAIGRAVARRRGPGLPRPGPAPQPLTATTRRWRRWSAGAWAARSWTAWSSPSSAASTPAGPTP